jgi:hypothetical protein
MSLLSLFTVNREPSTECSEPLPRLLACLNLLPFPLFLLPHRIAGQQTEVEVHGLEVGIGAGEMFGQGGKAGAVRPAEVVTTMQGRIQGCCGVESGGERFGIAFGAGDLARAEDLCAAQAQGGLQHLGRVEEGVAVHGAEACKLRGAQSGNLREDILLRAPLEARLEAHQVVQRTLRVLGAELDDREGALVGARVMQPDGA